LCVVACGACCRVSVFETLGVLHIQSVTKSDEASYSCVASSEGQHRVSDAATLYVHSGNLGTFSFSLRLSSSSSSSSVPSRSYLALVCFRDVARKFFFGGGINFEQSVLSSYHHHRTTFVMRLLQTNVRT